MKTDYGTHLTTAEKVNFHNNPMTHVNRKHAFDQRFAKIRLKQACSAGKSLRILDIATIGKILLGSE